MGRFQRAMAAPKIVFSAATLAAIQNADESPSVVDESGNTALITSSNISLAQDLACAICGRGSTELSWDASNKYYSAQVAMQPACLEELGARAPAAQAVMLTFERGDKASFKLAASEWDTYAAREEYEEPGALLVVPVYRPGGSNKTMSEQEVIEWAIENYGEVIDAIDLSKDPTIEHTDDDGCKVGIGRIREALQVVSWPVTGEPVPCPKPEAPAKPLAEQAAKGGDPAAELTEESAMRNIMSEAGVGAALTLPQGDGDDVEKAFAKAAQVRLNADSLPDDERRRRAADAAMQLMKSLGFDDEECSETESDDDGEGN